MIKLTITEKGGEPRALSFDQNEVSIGRVQGNDVVLAKGNISKRHSRLTLTDGKITVTDIKSTNGTYVNGRKIGDTTTVRPGDKIFVGDFLIVIDSTGAAPDISSTGSRRIPPPPPPPPPPPRPGSAGRPALTPPASLSANFGVAGDEAGMDLGDESHERPSPVVGRNRLSASALATVPAPPPPPPPRRTLTTSALEDDSADMGLGDEAPPSPDEVDAEMGDFRSADLIPTSGRGRDLQRHGSVDPRTESGGNDVFGSRPAADEDAGLSSSFQDRGAFGPPDDDERRGGIPTPAPWTNAASRATPFAAVGAAGGVGDTHGPGGVSLESLLGDPEVTSILVSVGGGIQIDRGGAIESVPAVGDGTGIAETVWQIANTAVPPPPSDNPVVDVRLPDGTRVTALFPPITGGSVCAAIRKAAPPALSLAEIAGSGDVEAIVRAALASRRNLLLAGEISAVSTLLAALADALPAERRVVSIGMGARSRPGWIELGLGLDPAALARAAVAFRADHLVFADAGGVELPDLLIGAARGQEGVIACMPARSAAEALVRLRAFTVGALGAPGFAALVSSTLDLIVLAGAVSPAGGVRILEIAEIQADGETLVPTSVARRPGGARSFTSLEVPGVSSKLAAQISASADGLPEHLVRR